MSKIITTDTPQDTSNPDNTLHTLSVYVNNKAGVFSQGVDSTSTHSLYPSHAMLDTQE